GRQAGSPAAGGYALRRSNAGGSVRALSGHMCRGSPERLVQRVTCAAGGLGDQVSVEVDRGSDRLVTEPAGDLGDRHAFSERGARESMPKIMIMPTSNLGAGK